ncbi:hypothetical protein DPMN_058321 [Dreissena polymorpha]|uniref:Uncharacterized protein n=1 Tax=Dreissena polymorpha TaxID=45954 RepID=A0A9D4HFD4_DREPO|nr:hypothetical protein DPMN_058321 [Dreissena polymorpha]
MSFPTSSSALSLSLLESVFQQYAYTDSHPSAISSPYSMVARLEDYIGRSTAVSTVTFFTSHTDARGKVGGAHLEPLSLII